MPAPQELLDLVARYSTNRDDYRGAAFNEAQVRVEFIDRMFKLLGWDINNKKGYSDAYKEVLHEDRVRVEGKSKAPDYSFRIGGVRKFLLEAKKPSVNISTDASAAFQVRRYAWSANLSLCVLTNFEELVIYDATIKPSRTDAARKGRAKKYCYTDYASAWDELSDLLSPDGIQRGNFDRFVAGAGSRRGSTAVDSQFLEDIEEWRLALAMDIAERNKSLGVRDLNYCVQTLIDRIIFLRIAEDRGIETYGRLKRATVRSGVYSHLLDAFRDADRRYNSGLFHLIKANAADTEADALTPVITISDDTLRKIINNLYYPESPYEFSVLPADILGQVYERFLGKVITLSGRSVKIDFKPDAKKSGGVFYTPSYIVRYIVNATVGKDLRSSGIGDISGQGRKSDSPYRVVDPACGSGSFLIEVYQTLLDWYLDKYAAAHKTYGKGKSATIYKGPTGWKLRIAERKRILLDHIYGVDIDPQAVEVTKLSLLLKVLEGENSDDIAKQMDLFKDRVLPDLSNNIKCGNSLIGCEYAELYPADLLDAERAYTVNPFDWKASFSAVFRSGGFDAVVGNPPYFSIDKTWGAGDHRIKALKAAYPHVHTDKTDIYYYFLAKAVDISQGSVGFIVSRAFLEAVKAEKVRGYISQHSGVVEILDFQNFPVFEGVGITTAIVRLAKHARPRQTHVVKVEAPIPVVDRTEGYLARGGALARFTVPRVSLKGGPWRLSSGGESALFAAIDMAGEPLSRICTLGQGMQTGANNVFGKLSSAEVAAMKAPESLIRKRVRNTDIQRFRIAERDEYLLYLEDVPKYEQLPVGIRRHLEKRPNREALETRAAYVRGNCEWWRYSWPLQKEKYSARPRILCPYLAPENRFAIDKGFTVLGLTDTTVVFDSGQREDLRYICSLLNSRLLTLRFRGIGKLKSGGIYEYFENSVGQLPIRRINWSKHEDVRVHDEIVEIYDKLAALYASLRRPLAATVARDIRRNIAKHETSLEAQVCELYGVEMSGLGVANADATGALEA